VEKLVGRGVETGVVDMRKLEMEDVGTELLILLLAAAEAPNMDVDDAELVTTRDEVVVSTSDEVEVVGTEETGTVISKHPDMLQV